MSDHPHYETFFSHIRDRLAADEADEDFDEQERHAEQVARGGIVGAFARVPFIVWTLLGLFGGMGAGLLALELGGTALAVFSSIGSGVKQSFSFLSTLVPVIIFFTLTPALITMFRTSSAGRFALAVMVAFSVTTALGGFWALLVTFAFFPDMPFGLGAEGLGATLRGLFGRTAELALSSPPFRAIWGSIVASVLLFHVGGMGHDTPRRRWQRMFWTVADIYELIGVYGVAALGRLIKIVMPYILFAIGVFLVINLPDALVSAAEEATQGATGAAFGAVEGYFVAVGILVVTTMLWLGVAVFGLSRYTGFPLGRLLSRYVAVVYPFSWATSSSAASIPINMEAARHGLHVRPPIRLFIIPLGATVNLDGTMMSAIVTTVVASKMVGYTPSIIDLLIALIPLVVITVGTPGVPGGLALVAAPVLASLLPLPPGTEALFGLIFVAYGFGLNDQFRTAVNTLDNGFLCLLFDKWWPQHFEPGAEPNPVFGSHGEPVLTVDAPPVNDASVDATRA